MRKPQRFHKLRLIRRWVSRVLLLLLLALSAFLFLGLPAGLLNPLLSAFCPEEVPVEADRLMFRPGTGWVLEDLRFYSTRDRITPWLTFKTVSMDVDLIHRLRQGEWRGDMQIRKGEIRTNLGFWADDLKTDQPFHVERIEGEFDFNESGVRITRLQADLGEFLLSAEGNVDPELFAAPAGKDRSAEAEGGLQRFAAALAPVAAYVEELRFIGKPEIQVGVEVGSGPESPLAFDLHLLHEEGARLRGFSFQSLSVAATLRDRVLNLKEVLVTENAERYLRSSGTVDFSRQRVQLDLRNTLQRYALEAISPLSIDQLLETLQVRVEGDLEVDLHLPESDFDRIGSYLEADLHLKEMFYKDAFFPEMSGTLIREPNRILLRNLKGQVGKGKGKGPVQGSVELVGNGEDMVLDLKGSFNPDEAISLMGPNTERMIRDWEFRQEPPEIELSFARRGRSGPSYLALSMKARNALCRGTELQRIEVSVELDEEELRIRDIQALRGTHTLKGEVTFPIDFSRADLNVISSFPLPDLAPFFGDWLVRGLQAFRFDGSCWLELAGHVDLSGRHEHQLEGKFIQNNLTWSWVQFRFLSSSFHLHPEGLSLPDIEGRLGEGSLKSAVKITDLFDPEDAEFELTMDVENVDLFQIITAATDTTDTPYKGTLNLDLELNGTPPSKQGPPWLPTLNGEGSVAIQDGSLFRIPLLLGLSRILSFVVKDFGYASQTDFTADFDLTDGVLKSDNLFLRGNFLSVAGKGEYELGGKIEANVKAQLFNTGILSEALKLVLWPIRKLVEIQLSGTLENPDWQPRNLPKELFGK